MGSRMSRRAVIFGGSGYIGMQVAKYLRNLGWEYILLCDIRVPSDVLPEGLEYAFCDVRNAIKQQIGDLKVDWIFNFAAVHREPGHEFREYFDTNLPGAVNICAYASEIGCQKIFFTSSIAVYGEIRGPTDESARVYPETGYGISKLCAELIHRNWQIENTLRRLVIVRPGVVYGPGDPGNILRMIRAIQRGRFLIPGDGSVRKSYAYIYGLLDSIQFAISRPESYLCYNYVEKNTECLADLAACITSELGIWRPQLHVPKSVLVFIASIAQLASGRRSPLHPVRVRKASMSTHIVPAELIRLGFSFRYDFAESLKHWRVIAPGDFV